MHRRFKSFPFLPSQGNQVIKMPLCTLQFSLLTFHLSLSFVAFQANAQEPSPVLKLAFVSNREHYWYPHVYLYEHDGKSTGKVTGAIDPKDKRLDHQPILSDDGQFCVYGFELEAQVG